MNTTYDIAIIGAGPAGLLSALTVRDLSGSAKVLLVDKVAPWEREIICAEGVFRPSFHSVMEPEKHWIRTVIGKAVFHSPDGNSITYGDKNKGYILDRAVMQKDLAHRCQDQDIDCAFCNKVADVSTRGDTGARTVTFVDGTSIAALVVIDCAGPLSPFGKSDNILWKPQDLEPSLLAHVSNVDIGTPMDTVHVWAAKKLAPGGYAWAFPRGEKSYNVGVIIGRGFRTGANIRQKLTAFINEHIPNAMIEKTAAGSIPCACAKGPYACPGLIKAGDSASTVNPISRAGIVEAMMSGQVAAQTAIEMLGATKEKELITICKKHHKAWDKKKGKRLYGLAKAKPYMAKVPDKDYNAATAAMSNREQKGLVMSQIFKLCLGRFPRLVWALRHIV